MKTMRLRRHIRVPYIEYHTSCMLTVVLLALCFSSCKDIDVGTTTTTEESDVVTENEIASVPQFRIPIEVAQKEAEYYATFLDEQTRSEDQDDLELFDEQPQRFIANSYLVGASENSSNNSQVQLYNIDDTPSKENEIPELYIINYANKKGFVLMSADSRFRETLIIAEEGNLNKGDTLSNPGFIIMLDRAVNYMKRKKEAYLQKQDSIFAEFEKESSVGNKSSKKSGYKLYSEYSRRYDAARRSFFAARTRARELGIRNAKSTSTRVGPLLKTKWGQGSPYNNGLGKAFGILDSGCDTPLLGCVPVALAQIMAYHKWPTEYVFPGHSLMNTQWDQWLDAPNLNSLVNFYRALVFYSNVKPTCSGSGQWPGEGTGITHAVTFVRDFFISIVGNNYVEPVHKINRVLGDHYRYHYGDAGVYDKNKIVSSITNKRPVYISGKAVAGQRFGGHAWVLDGYVKVRTTFSYSYRDFVPPSHSSGPWTPPRYGREINVSETTTKTYIHANLGWDGVKNGYYLSGIFNAGEGPEKSSATTLFGKDHNYVHDLAVSTNIRPKK